MRHRLLAVLLVPMLAGWCGPTPASGRKPPQVQDLHYGEVLFHFYKGDYFTAITHLMAARQQEQLPHHAQDAELLLGGLQLSYGMRNEAEQQFLASMDKATDRNIRNRVWFYLGKIAYQRGRFDQALNALRKFEDSRDAALSAQHAVLLANTEMALGNDGSAADSLKDVSAPEGIEEYLRINRGIALLRMGDVDAGRQVLEMLGRTETDDEQLRALRDRANLGLGYELLRAQQPEAARASLNRVRLTGPFAASALLGAGWSDAARGDFDGALTPWLELAARDGYDTAVQEAQLAVPFALEKLNDQTRAVHFYKQAIGYFDKEETELDSARNSVENDMLHRIVAQLPGDFSGGWLHHNEVLEAIPGSSYLIEVLAGNTFQEHLKNYRDLTFLAGELERWKDSLDLLRDMVDARRQAYKERAPRVRERLAKNEAADVERRLQDYQRRFAELETRRDPMDLATAKERRQWNKLATIEQRLAERPNDTQTDQMLDKARWLKGVLYWQIQADYPARLWNVKKALRDLQEPVLHARTGRDRVEAALGNAASGFAGYDEKIAQLQSRILALLPTVKHVRATTGGTLKRLALDALDKRRERLISYRNQARYALARNYDLLAQQKDSGK
jgi:tetratricopeptide (TPR) repeat protein